jgi:hypothetical protein
MIETEQRYREAGATPQPRAKEARRNKAREAAEA